MPTMANITVKDAANADILWTAAVPSSGDRSPAVWRSNSASDKLAFRPSFSLQTKTNSRGNGRNFHAEFNFPLSGVNSNTGTPFLTATIPMKVDGTLPMNVDVATLNNAYVQFGNLLVSALIRTAIQEGYAPT